MDLDGNLLLGVGDDVNPHSEPSGGYAPLSERTTDPRLHDARATSANTNDLRGKLLRITPEPHRRPRATRSRPATCSPRRRTRTARPGPRSTRWASATRSASRSTRTPAGSASPTTRRTPAPTHRDTRGPAGIVEYNLIKTPGNYGWPLCMGDNEPFRDVDYTTSPVTVGPFFDCANPVNDSILNTGRTNLPPAQAPVMYYGYTKSSVPAVIPAGGGLAPMGGPFYDFDPALASDVKFPEYFDGKPFFYEWSKNRIYSMTLDDEGTKLEKISASCRTSRSCRRRT